MASRMPLVTGPVTRTVNSTRLIASGEGRNGGVEASRTACDNLTGLAQQMCYAVMYRA